MCVYSRTLKDEINQTLFAGFMAALGQFSKSWAAQSLNSFSLGQTRFTILSSETLMFVANTSTRVKEKQVSKELAMMRDIFFKKFDVKEFGTISDVPLDTFRVLDDDYRRFLLEPAEKMRSAIW